jgi:hypothetical protein
MKLILRVLGIQVATLEVDGLLVETEEEEDEEGARIEGGSAHNFERDVDPLKPEDRYDWEWEDKRRGFGFR